MTCPSWWPPLHSIGLPLSSHTRHASAKELHHGQTVDSAAYHKVADIRRWKDSGEIRMRAVPFLRAVSCVLLTFSAASAADPQPLGFRLTFDPSISRTPFTGRVFILLSKNEPGRDLPQSPSWFKPEPIFAKDVKDWQPGKSLVIANDAIGYPTDLSHLPKGDYFVRAVMDFGRGISFAAAPGNGYCGARRVSFDPHASAPIDLRLDRVYVERKFQDSERIKLVEIESKLLSKFHGRPVTLRAAVVLPASWQASTRRKYPVVYEIPGFGGNHFMASRRQSFTDVGGVEMIWVVLDPSCPLGHHVFADSANNGPCGQALTEELIPVIEKRFHGVGSSGARFVTGHSSGGWSSLWLQVRYPDFFGGVWSTAPDPVDFRDFQQINLTQPGVNMFYDQKGEQRPVARSSGRPTLFYKAFSDMEEVMGHGGQLKSFEAVFSPRGLDGQPKPLWNRKTGAVDPEVAREWSAYDIRLYLKRNWATLVPKLKGKIHVYMGGDDTFYLDGAVRLLGESLKELGSDAVVEIFPGKNHGTLVDAALRGRINREMAEQAQQSAAIPR